MRPLEETDGSSFEVVHRVAMPRWTRESVLANEPFVLDWGPHNRQGIPELPLEEWENVRRGDPRVDVKRTIQFIPGDEIMRESHRVLPAAD
jgi:hypothetical protein